MWESGHEHFAGSLIVPVKNRHGQMGRSTGAGSVIGPAHLYLPGSHGGLCTAGGGRTGAGIGRPETCAGPVAAGAGKLAGAACAGTKRPGTDGGRAGSSAGPEQDAVSASGLAVSDRQEQKNALQPDIQNLYDPPHKSISLSFGRATLAVLFSLTAIVVRWEVAVLISQG